MTRRKRRIRQVAAVAGLLAMAAVAWFVVRSGPERMRQIVTVDDTGDTLVYSGPVRDAIARARIIEAFNSVSAPDPNGPPETTEADSAGREAAARAARQAAVDELARLYAGPAHPDAILGALNLAVLAFDPGSATPPADAAGFLQAAAEVIDRAPDGTVFVVAGRAPADADSLAVQRAQAVVDALVKAGADADRLRAEAETRRRPDGRTAEQHEDRGHIVFRLGMAPPDDEDARGGSVSSRS